MTKTLVDTFDPTTLDHSQEWINFLGRLAVATNNYREHRKGQAIMNALHEVRPDLYEFATGAVFDPFYQNDRLFVFWHKIYDQFIMTMDN